jgi:hypothetical protein
MTIPLPAIHLKAQGRELPYQDREALQGQISIYNQCLTLQQLLVNGPVPTTGNDVLEHFDTDKSPGDRHGFLLPIHQIFTQGDHSSHRPCAVHGQQVDARPPLARVRVPVDLHFIQSSGIPQRLEASGFEVNGVVEQRLKKLELDGWEPIIENDRYGKHTQYFLQDSPLGREPPYHFATRTGSAAPAAARDCSALMHY